LIHFGLMLPLTGLASLFNTVSTKHLAPREPDYSDSADFSDIPLASFG